MGRNGACGQAIGRPAARQAQRMHAQEDAARGARDSCATAGAAAPGIAVALRCLRQANERGSRETLQVLPQEVARQLQAEPFFERARVEVVDELQRLVQSKAGEGVQDQWLPFRLNDSSQINASAEIRRGHGLLSKHALLMHQ